MDGVVLTTAGMLRGVEEAGLWVFRGVPYAHAGGGRRRWRPPEPPDAWRGVRDSASWGPLAPQARPQPGFSVPGDPTHTAEDCLNLNVWTPGIDDHARPVMVWVHGGGFTTGTGASLLFRGDRLATRGGVVVVTINYRLGALGFLAHPSLADAVHGGWGNWGLLDQLAALSWVAENIAAFGGDPSNVTVFGESAGAMSISALLAAPAAAGLFRRAVIQSGPPATAATSWAVRRAERLAAAAGLPGVERAALEHLPADALVRATQELALELPGDGGLPLTFMPVVGDGLLARPPGEAVIDGQAAAVPVIIGTTRDETALFTAGDIAKPDLDAEGVVRRLCRHLEVEAAGAVVDAYQRARRARGEPVAGRDLWTAVTTDYVFRLPSLAMACAQGKHQPATFAYLFSWESPFMGGAFGSSHGLDIPFVFGTVHEESLRGFTGYSGAAARISEQMQQAWLAFARTGDPSCDAVGPWPSYDPLRRPTMVFGVDGGVQEDPRGEERAAWDAVGFEAGVGHHHE